MTTTKVVPKNDRDSAGGRTEERLTANQALRVVPIDKIGVDPSYQRGVRGKHKKIVTEFDANALGVPVVGEREDGSLWIVDGLQRMTALSKLERKTMRAEVFKSDGPEHEAAIFRKINQNRTKLTPGELFQARLTEGDEAAWAIKKLVEAEGMRLVTNAGRHEAASQSSREVTAINTLVRIYETQGGGAISFALKAIQGGWPNDPVWLKSDLIKALAGFYHAHDGAVDLGRLTDRMMTTTPAKVMYSAGLGAGDRSTNATAIVEKLYRKQLRRK